MAKAKNDDIQKSLERLKEVMSKELEELEE